MKMAIIFSGAVLLGLLLVVGTTFLPTAPIPSKTQTPQNTTPSNLQFSIENAPSDSLKGTIATMSGEVKWQSRVATEPAILTKLIQLSQGEKIVTGDDGKISLTFGSELTIIQSPKTELELVQTLPMSFVIQESSGSAVYEKNGSTPLAIRSLHLLTVLTSGKMTEKVSEATGTILVTVEHGAITAAYNDTENVSHELAVGEGEKLTFDDATRTVHIK